MAARTITTAELAAELDTTPRTLRKFLRSEEGPGKVGKGARYALPADKRSINALAKKFAKWVEATEAAKAAESDESDIEDEALETE